MIKLNKTSKEEYCQCTSCLRDNEKTDIYKFQIGKVARNTITIKLCYECLCEFVGKSVLVCNGTIKKD